MSTVEELTQKVEELSILAKKQSDLLAKTGEQVLSLQVQNQKTRVSEFGSFRKSKSSFPQHIDTSDFATNEDLVQLVGELEGQLEILEERSIRRLINSKKKEGETLAPVLNHNGEEPDLSRYPKDIAAFEKIDDETLVNLARFYQLLPPTKEERAKFEELIEAGDPKLEISVDVKPSDFTEDILIDAFDDLARFLGLPSRRGADAW